MKVLLLPNNPQAFAERLAAHSHVRDDFEMFSYKADDVQGERENERKALLLITRLCGHPDCSEWAACSHGSRWSWPFAATVVAAVVAAATVA